MKGYTIDKNQLPDLIQHLLQSYIVWGPRKDDNGLVYGPITSPKEISLEFQKVKMPPKTIVFPQTETLLRFKKGKNLVVEEPVSPDKKTVIFGIRPCDARSMQLFDMIFREGSADPYYCSKRDKIISVGFTCVVPPENCFCTSVNGNPDDSTGLDVLMTEISDTYYIDIITKKGEELLKDFKPISLATHQDLKKRNDVCQHAKNAIKRCVSVKDIDTILDTIYSSLYWMRIAQRCIGCGICTFLCPTCHCFDIQDETSQDKGARIRVWDSCMYPEYSCQASGYNPRTTQMNRLRNRIYHKFNYLPKNNQILGCVGCGRCIDECPVHIDIIEILQNAREVKE